MTREFTEDAPHETRRQSIQRIVRHLNEEFGLELEDPTSTSFSQEIPEDCHSLARFIDHTLLKPDATEDDISRLCREAVNHEFHSVCVNPCYVSLCSRLLGVTTICAVVGFPLGAMTSEAKAFETDQARKLGANEIDMVLPIGRLRAGEFDLVYRDVQMVVRAGQGLPVKVILETGFLNDEQKITGTLLAKAAGAAAVKTSTGFGPSGATVEDVTLLRAVAGSSMGVKASGGIRTCAIAMEMLRAGASRLGTSASVAIVEGHAEAAAGSAGAG